ncbi:hypothetical protein KAU51_00135 [Candidatus Parcubacteria bacterium]|nr:hypothetical protein [Candidatus Parcubacteria bacterium]
MRRGEKRREREILKTRRNIRSFLRKIERNLQNVSLVDEKKGLKISKEGNGWAVKKADIVDIEIAPLKKIGKSSFPVKFTSLVDLEKEVKSEEVINFGKFLEKAKII